MYKSTNRGRLAIFIDGNNLFHAARSVGVEIDYAKLLDILRGNDNLLRAFFYTGVDQNAERQQGFLLWMRRNGYRVVEKDLKTFPDGTKKVQHVEDQILQINMCDFVYQNNIPGFFIAERTTSAWRLPTWDCRNADINAWFSQLVYVASGRPTLKKG